MQWAKVIQRLRRERVASVLITVTAVRGHAPRDPGAKMIVTREQTFGTVGGGNLEESAIVRGRAMLDERDAEPELLEMGLNTHADNRYGVQCCGGEVTMLLEPVPTVPAVAIFGMGHVGRELARVLSRHDIDLYLADSRAAQVDSSLSQELADAVAEVNIKHTPVPESLLPELPQGTHVLIMSHDHAEDAALCDASLRLPNLGTIGLIGSRSKWRRFEKTLAEEGHSATDIARIQCPIGVPEIVSKEPAAIAVSVAAQLLQVFAAEHSTSGDQS